MIINSLSVVLMHTRTPLVALALVSASALTLAGCAQTSPDTGEPGATDGAVQVVASTSVYGEIAREIGGDDVEVTALVTGQAQDPHEYEPSAKDRLLTSEAQLVVMNGGGYDAYMDTLLGDAKTPRIVATDFAEKPEGAEEEGHAHEEEDHAHEAEGDDHGHTHIEGFNEHVWYDFDVMADVADALVAELSALKPDAADAFAKRGATFDAELDALEQAASQVTGDHVHIFVTEPVPLALTDHAGLHNVAPAAFTEAVEEGQDVAPAVLLQSISLLKDEDVRAVIVNAQTGGAETTKMISEAEKLGIPVLEFSELIPADTSYGEWMQSNIDALSEALAR